VGAESPPETVLRLAVADLAPGLRSQIPVLRENGTLLTSVDLGWEDRRVHLFYDGGHHLEDGQRDHDSEVLAVLQQDGGRVFRVSAGMIRDVGEVRKLRERVAAALAG
jgi:very-short-patch-repair endonuclease